VLPQSTQEVSSVLEYCNSRKLGVVPQGGNTGLVGGSVPINTEVVLSLEKMNDIHKIDPMTGILLCDAGCILQNLQDYAAEHDHLFPVDLGSKGTCQIGGNISTNAGGSFYYRYGSFNANVMGLEVVLANGDILNLGCDPALLKDNTGYNLKNLFLGAEGTLGVGKCLSLQSLSPPHPTQ
jgi:FAD/FMN-containing dehydrogenase